MAQFKNCFVLHSIRSNDRQTPVDDHSMIDAEKLIQMQVKVQETTRSRRRERMSQKAKSIRILDVTKAFQDSTNAKIETNHKMISDLESEPPKSFLKC